MIDNIPSNPEFARGRRVGWPRRWDPPRWAPWRHLPGSNPLCFGVDVVVFTAIRVAAIV